MSTIQTRGWDRRWKTDEFSDENGRQPRRVWSFVQVDFARHEQQQLESSITNGRQSSAANYQQSNTVLANCGAVLTNIPIQLHHKRLQ